jgi:signal peptidase I
MLPGPTTVHPRVLSAMSQAVVNHRGAKYGEILTETTELMSKVFQTPNKSYLLTGSGTSAMEAAVANTVAPGEKILNVVTTIIIILLFISVVASFQTTFFGKKYNSFFGYSLFEIETASMSGKLEIGDWILVKITDDVKLNDIITFEENGSFITHRIVEQYKDTYVTKGDSNNAKDTPIKKEQVVGKMIKVIPKFGIIKKTFFNPKVLIILIITIVVGSSLFDKTSKT